MGGRGTNATRNTGSKKERPINTDITRRQLKLHVTAKLKEAGFEKAVITGSAIRGVPIVYNAGFDWYEIGKDFPPSITYALTTFNKGEEDQKKLKEMAKALQKDFKIETDRGFDNKGNILGINIIGEYRKEK